MLVFIEWIHHTLLAFLSNLYTILAQPTHNHQTHIPMQSMYQTAMCFIDDIIAKQNTNKTNKVNKVKI